MNLVCFVLALACLIQFVATQSKHDTWVKPLSKKQSELWSLKFTNIFKTLKPYFENVGKRLKGSGKNAAYYSGQTEGDMVLSPEQIAMLYEGTDDKPQNRNGR